MSTTTEQTIQSWTTENSDAIVWGTHNPEAARQVYDSEGFDYEADWDNARKMWAAPHLIEEEVWEDADYGDEPREGWIPYMVYGL